MEAVLAGVSAAIAVLALARSRGKPSAASLGMAALAAAACAAAGLFFDGPVRTALLAGACGAALGGVASLGGRGLAGTAFGGALAGLGLGLAGWLLPADQSTHASVALATGAALGGGLGALTGSASVAVWSLVGIGLMGGAALGLERIGGPPTQAAWLLMAAAAAPLLASFAEPKEGESRPPAFVGLVILLALSSLLVPAHTAILAVAALGVGVVAWSMGGRPGGVPVALALAVWVGLATFAFAEARGLGMALVGVVAVAGLASAPSPSARLTLGPLLALAAYRLFREVYPDTSRALDIGQHYAILGIVVGVAIVLGAADWARTQERAFKSAAAGVVVAILTLGCVGVAIVMLGAKGAVGLMVGFGLAPAVEAFRGERNPAGLVVACGALGAAIGLYGILQPWLDLSRDVKLQVLVFAVVGALLLAGAARLLSAPRAEEAHEAS